MLNALTLTALLLTACATDDTASTDARPTDTGIGATSQSCDDFAGIDYRLIENPIRLCNIDLDGIDYFVFGGYPAFFNGHRADGSSGGATATRITNTTWSVDAVMWMGQLGKTVALNPQSAGRCKWMACL